MVDYYYYTNYSNKQIIENSIIDIEIENDYNFKMPVFVKNSTINFKNINYD
jgi:DNA-binding sugar fermentation-stimulating protein